jgi:hypothetical protein
MVTLGYGAVMFGIALALEQRFGLMQVTTMLTTAQLALLLVGGGTMGLHLFRATWQAQGRLHVVRRFAVWLSLALLVASTGVDLHPRLGNEAIEVALAHLSIGCLFVGLALAHIYLPTLKPKAVEPETEATSDD